MDKVALVNLGCPKNQIDAETMLGLLAEQKYQVIHNPEQAEIIIVNTCGFIDKARQESVEQILAMAEYKKTGRCRQLIVTGCLPQRYYNELTNELPEVDVFLGTGSVDKIVEVVTSKRSLITQPDLYDGQAETRRLFSTYPYAYLKIAEGCNNWCSYCVIPQLRGRLRSKERNQILEEARRMAESGIREIVLVAQDTSQYGLDFGGRSQLPGLLKDLEQIEDVQWIRLLYCYPDHITDQLIEVMANSVKIQPYLDIPLQHSHPDILVSMGRHRSAKTERELIHNLREHIPGIALRTTFIVGYPGESDEHFQHLLDFVRWAEFDHLGAFMYSQEDGTRAAKIKEQVPAKVKASRYAQLMQTQQAIVFKHNSLLVGQRYVGLIDSVHGGKANIRSFREAPEVDSMILAPAKGHRAGDFVRVSCTGYDGYDLLGVIENGQ